MTALAQQGQYHAQITNVETLKNKNDTPFVFIEFKSGFISHDGEWVELPDDITGELYIYLSDAAYESSEKKLRSLGFNGDYANPVMTIAQKDGMIVSCTHETYKGQEREKWELEGWGYQRQSPEANVLAQLQARWNQNESSAAKPAAAPAPPQAATAPAPVRPTQAGPASPPPAAPVPSGGPDDDEPPF